LSYGLIINSKNKFPNFTSTKCLFQKLLILKTKKNTHLNIENTVREPELPIPWRISSGYTQHFNPRFGGRKEKYISTTHLFITQKLHNVVPRAKETPTVEKRKGSRLQNCSKALLRKINQTKLFL